MSTPSATSGNPNFDFDHEYIISRCNERGKVVEINNASLNVRAGSKKNCADIARMCMKYEVPIVVDSDSHICFRVGHVEGALEMLEEIGFPEELIINSSMARLDAYFKGPRHGSVQRRRIRGILMRIGIDLGGTSVKAALCADDGAILIKQSVPTKTGDPDGLRADMKQLALALCASGGVQPDEVESIGIGVPGSYDKPSCTLRFGTNLGMNDVCFAETFQPEFGCAVQLDNDANCAALGEATAGAGKNVKNMLMVTLGTGVGGGIIIDGKLYTGCNSLAGELGHIVIRQGGEPCGCGRRGCLEAYSSAAALVKFAHRALDAGRRAACAKTALTSTRSTSATR